MDWFNNIFDNAGGQLRFIIKCNIVIVSIFFLGGGWYLTYKTDSYLWIIFACIICIVTWLQSLFMLGLTEMMEDIHIIREEISDYLDDQEEKEQYYYNAYKTEPSETEQ